MRRTELITKALFYFLLPALVVMADNLQTFGEWDMSPDGVRKLIIIPIIVGLTNLKGFFSETYAWFLETMEPKQNPKHEDPSK